MKGIRIGLILFWALLAVVLVSFLAVELTVGLPDGWFGSNWVGTGWSDGMSFNIFGGGYSSWGGGFDGTEVNGEARLSADEVLGIDIRWLGGTVEVKRHSDDDVRILQSCVAGEIPEDRRLVYRIDGGVLRMREGKERVIRSRTNTNITVYLPDDGKEYSVLSIDAVSAGIFVSDVEVASTNIDSVSGGVVLEGINVSGDCNIESVSGSIKLRGMTIGGKLETQQVSGSTSLDDVAAAELVSEAVSGSINAKGAFGRISTDSVSGSTHVYSSVMPSSADMDTVSGGITLGIPDNIGFDARYSRVSGSFSCDFATTTEKNRAVYGDGSANISFDSISGSMKIVRYDAADTE